MSRNNAEPSPKFSVEYTSIQANGALMVDPSLQAPASKYKPFDGIQIQNSSSEDLKIQLNDQSDNSIILESGTSFQEEFPQIQPFSSFRVKNLGSTAIADSDLRIVYYKAGMGADKAAYREVTQKPSNKIIEKFTGFNPSWV